MENRETKDNFSYAYSAKQQDEINRIRQKYMPREEDRMEQLRRLDASVYKKGTIVSLIVGIVSALVMGTGMSCVLVWGDTMFVPGLIIGVIGLVGVALAYPLYTVITRKEKERLAPEILRLTEELMK